jgi:hypothetical protein
VALMTITRLILFAVPVIAALIDSLYGGRRWY